MLGLKDVGPNEKSHRIDNLCEIGWLDPFPEIDAFENTFNQERPVALQKQKAALNYVLSIEGEQAGVKKMVSFVLPSKAVIVKIMRACIAVKHPKDLWMYKE